MSSSASRLRALAVLSACALCAAAALCSASARSAPVHFICSGANSANVPCYFSTPDGDVRCKWIPSPNHIDCDLAATGYGYLLRPTGDARHADPHLSKRGSTLPTSQMLVFPDSLSCQDTDATMQCSQDFGLGTFKLG